MKKLLITTAAIVAALASGSAFAADLGRPVVKAPVVAPVPYYNWSGFYIGGHIGGGWADPHYTNLVNTTAFGDLSPGNRFSHDASGILGGGQVGFNWQTGNIVFGLEASFSGADINGTFNNTVFGAADDVFTTRIRSLFLGTGRIGVAWNNWLLYATGGYAGADVRARVSDTVGLFQGSGSDSQWLSGWTVGAGAEFGFTPNWSLALQYNYVKLENSNFELAGTVTPPVCFGACSYLFRVNTDMHIATARLNYRFNWGGPVMASY